MWTRRIAIAFGTAAGVAVALWASAAPALEKPRTFSLLEVDRTFMPLGDFEFDRAPVGGDQFAEANTLYRWTGAKGKGARVGRNRVLVTFVTGYGKNLSHRATVFVQAQLYLPDGTLSVEGFAGVPPRGLTGSRFPWSAARASTQTREAPLDQRPRGRNDRTHEDRPPTAALSEGQSRVERGDRGRATRP